MLLTLGFVADQIGGLNIPTSRNQVWLDLLLGILLSKRTLGNSLEEGGPGPGRDGPERGGDPTRFLGCSTCCARWSGGCGPASDLGDVELLPTCFELLCYRPRGGDQFTHYLFALLQSSE